MIDRCHNATKKFGYLFGYHMDFLKIYFYEKFPVTRFLGIRDSIVIILWAINFINKHNLVKVVQEKSNQILLDVNDFKKMFQEHFDEGLPPFWDDNGKFFSQEWYHRLLVHKRMDHSKFEELTKGLT